MSFLHFFYGCAALQQLVLKPPVDFEGVSVSDVSLFEETLLLKLSVNNPNPIGISLRNVAYELTLNNSNDFKKALRTSKNKRQA